MQYLIVIQSESTVHFNNSSPHPTTFWPIRIDINSISLTYIEDDTVLRWRDAM